MQDSKIRTHRIGANPQKLSLVNFRGPDRRKFSELCVCPLFLGKKNPRKCSPKPGLVNQCLATLRGELTWTGPIANRSEKRQRGADDTPVKETSIGQRQEKEEKKKKKKKSPGQKIQKSLYIPRVSANSENNSHCSFYGV